EKFDNLMLELINGSNFTIERNGELMEKEIPVDFISTLLEDEERMRFLSIRAPFMVNKVPDTSHNKLSGFRPRDEFLSINGSKAVYRDQVASLLEANKGKQVDVEVLREDGREEHLTAMVDQNGKLGIELSPFTMQELQDRGFFRLETQKYSFLEAIPAGINKGVTTLSSYMKQLKKIFNPE